MVHHQEKNCLRCGWLFIDLDKSRSCILNKILKKKNYCSKWMKPRTVKIIKRHLKVQEYKRYGKKKVFHLLSNELIKKGLDRTIAQRIENKSW